MAWQFRKTGQHAFTDQRNIHHESLPQHACLQLNWLHLFGFSIVNTRSLIAIGRCQRPMLCTLSLLCKVK